MYIIEKEVGLDAGHRVPTHGSKCRNLHGHRYTVIAIVQAPEVVPDEAEANNSGMVMDFGALKQGLLEVVHDPYDHKLILWHKDPLLTGENATKMREVLYSVGIISEINEAESGVILVPCIPTAENLAKHWYLLLQEWLKFEAPWANLVELVVWETPTSKACYRP